jgi:FKBP-type peptidyl-prolyl cis-trans isomerase
MFSKFELAGGAICVGLMSLAIFMVQTQSDLQGVNQSASVIASTAVVVPEGSENNQRAQVDALLQAASPAGELERMVIDEIKIGTGAEATQGDTVSAHYVGRLQDGTEFDNSQKRGAPIEFTLGARQVIAGWEEGIVGMQVGGERILVIPPEKAYGANGVGPIPPNATLVFSVELMEIK